MSEIQKWVINLKDRTDRRREMIEQLERVGWSAQFFPAVRPADAGTFPSIGARGCFLSHLALLKQATSGHILLMEDDLNFVPQFQDALEQSIRCARANGMVDFLSGHLLKGDGGPRED